MSPTLQSETKDGEKPEASGNPEAGSVDAQAELLLKVAAMCDAVTQRLAVQHSREPELRPQLTVPASLANRWREGGDPITAAISATTATRAGGPNPGGYHGHGQGPGPSRRDQGNANFHIFCRRCRRRPQTTSDGGPVGWASRQIWEEQPRPERGEAHVIVSKPLRGLTLEDRHPNEPAALLCPLGRVPELAQETHRAGLLHVTREAADRAARRQNHDKLQRAIGVVRRQRP
ncbi:hypothetical protein HPB47_026176 [Ixodes persulcatus]|uniref:Uncharacterized protein n=1 Tax=Ixodes persulcatus TaxID=34615 RepID=A0AC60Q014_IXOPE|nr:hypothetical protein HPB47_026176 [Ixodes persulcatus]